MAFRLDPVSFMPQSYLSKLRLGDTALLDASLLGNDACYPSIIPESR